MATTKRNKRNTPDLRKTLFARFMLVVGILVIWIGGIGVRLVYLQVNQHEYLRDRALAQRLNIKKTKQPRGTIYDRNGRMLAISIPVKTLYADPEEIEDTARASRAIAKAVGGKAGEILTLLNQAKSAGKRFLPLAKKLDEDTVKKVNRTLFDPEAKKADEPNFTGLHWSEDLKRSYPHGSLAAQVVGFANANDDGMGGVEQSQDENLRGAVIKKLQERDRLGRVYDETVFEREPPKDVVLTLNSTYQYFADEALERGVKTANAKSGMVVVLDPKNGEILALANYPSFDPASIGSAGTDLANHAIQSVYSPGSVFKLITYGAALEKKLIRPDDEVDAGNGTIDVAGHVFKDSHHVGRVTYAQALAHSSNVCAIKTSLRVGKTDFYSLLQKMGFGSRTGVELPAETAGIVRSPDRWNGDSLASMSIGYEIGVTALQMANAFATIANDGVKNQPHIIKEIRDSDGNILSAAEPQQTPVVSAETAESLRTMLRQVVLTGTGRRAQLDGFSSAGKTGTAWKFDAKTKRVDPSKYISSFIGFAPVDDPQFVIAVVMDEPKVGARDGGTVSAPVFRELAERILKEMNVTPDLDVNGDTLIAADIPETPEMPIVRRNNAATTPNREAKAERPEKKPPSLPPAGKSKPDKPGVDKLVGSNYKRVAKYGSWEVRVTRPKT